MKYLPILLLLWTLPARALVSDEINRACQKRAGVYQACLANLAHHPEWLLHQAEQLKASPASGPFRASPGGKVLAGTLELSNATALEQQETYRALSAYAGITGSRSSSRPGRARRDLLALSQRHDQRCLVSLNNLPHQSEPGFRASDVLVCDLSGFRLRATQGTLRETRDPYHLAIDGEGYFVLEGGLLTRSGEFQMDRDGRLVSKDGLALQGQDGPVDVPDDYTNVQIKGDGTIFGTPFNGDGRPQLVTQLQLAQVADPSWLVRSGSNLRATVKSGAPRLQTPGQDGCGVVAQGYLENSNLSAIDQMKTLQALRNYAQLLRMPLSDDYQP